jgi:hypothetical protein
MLPGILGSMPGLGAGAATASYMGVVDEGVSVTFGAAASDRRIVAVIHWQELNVHRTLTSATIGGQAATIHVQRGHSGGGTGLGIAIISAIVASGASGVINCTFSGSVNPVYCGVYRLTGLSSGTPTDTITDEHQVTTADCTGTITVAANGVVIAGYTGSTTASSPVSWTGVTEQYDDDLGIHYSSGFESGLSAQNRNIIADINPQSNSGNDMAVASWS